MQNERRVGETHRGILEWFNGFFGEANNALQDMFWNLSEMIRLIINFESKYNLLPAIFDQLECDNQRSAFYRSDA